MPLPLLVWLVLLALLLLLLLFSVLTGLVLIANDLFKIHSRVRKRTQGSKEKV